MKITQPKTGAVAVTELWQAI